MIHIDRAGAEDLETIIAIQRASFKAVYEKYQDQYDPYLEEKERIRWKLVERPNSFYYFVKDDEKILGFIRLNTNDEQTAGWIGTVAILPQYQNKGYGSEGLGLIEEKFSTVMQWDLCTVFQDKGMVAFYEKNGYSLLKKDETLTNLEVLASFWVNVAEQDDSVFSETVLKKLSVLNYAPNGMWAYLTSVYFMQNKGDNGSLDNAAFNEFLDKIIAFIWTYAIMRPGVNALRTPVYPEMINVVNNKRVTFDDYKFDEDSVRLVLESYQFTNGRPITKSMLAWWMYINDKQDLLLLDTKLEIEHIYSRKRQENENGLADKWSLESLGNKALLEKAINIRASDYRFIDKLKYYKGFVTDKGKVREGTKNMELIELSTNSNDFMEADIVARKDLIISKFIDKAHTVFALGRQFTIANHNF